MSGPDQLPSTERRRWLGEAWVRPEALNVAPSLVGEPLAPPSRRALAMLIDLAAVSLIAHRVHGLALLGALLAGAAWLWADRRGRAVHRATMALAALMVAVGLVASVRGGGDATGGPAHADAGSTAEVRDALTEVAATLAEARGSAAAGPTGAAAAVAGTPAASAAAQTASAAEGLAQAQARLDALEALQARQAAAGPTEVDRLRRRLSRWLDEVGPSYGWSLLYWSMLPALWRGQTLGKRLCGLRVVELTGRPMTPWLGLKRYGGYAAGLATGGLGLAQALWDPNRQALHDKAAHTVVVDLRAAQRPAGSRPD